MHNEANSSIHAATLSVENLRALSRAAHAANREGGADVWLVIPLSSRLNREPG